VFRGYVLAAALACALTSLGACAVTGSTDITAPPGPVQVDTLAGAVTVAAAAERAATVYVETGHPTKAQLGQLDALRAGVHGTLAELEADQVHGQPLVFDAFNAALAAFKAFTKPT
jgi:hypothetical protein